jgi:hypothetical protein
VILPLTVLRRKEELRGRGLQDLDAQLRTRRDERDGEVGIVGYEINFNRYFYRYTPPRPLEEIEADIRQVEQDTVRMLGEVMGGWHG